MQREEGSIFPRLRFHLSPTKVMMRRFRGVCQMDSEKTFSESENVMVQVSCRVLLKINTKSAVEVMQFAVLGGLSFFCEMHWVTWRKIVIAKLATL